VPIAIEKYQASGGRVTRREFNEKLLKVFLYAVLVFSGAGSFSFLQAKTFKNSCPRDYYCLSRCPFDAISLDEEGYPQIDEKKCVAYNAETKRYKWRKCGLCLKGCPTRALELLNNPS
jgi:ferredoxin